MITCSTKSNHKGSGEEGSDLVYVVHGWSLRKRKKVNIGFIPHTSFYGSSGYFDIPIIVIWAVKVFLKIEPTIQLSTRHDVLFSLWIFLI